MKRLLTILCLSTCLSSPALAQWQVPNNQIPLGKGAGKVGFGAVTGSAGGGTKCLLDTVPPAFGTCPVPAPRCPPTWFCVAEYANTAAAVTALNAAGGGTLYFGSSVTLTAAQTIGNNTNIVCANQGVIIGTSSTSLDLLLVTGTPVTIRDCQFAYTGVPGDKDGGALLHLSGTTVTLESVLIGPHCFICIKHDGIVASLTDIGVSGNTVAPKPGSAVLTMDSQVLHVSNFTLGASLPATFYTNGLLLTSGAFDAANVELIQADTAVHLNPGNGQAVFAKMTTSYIDNCGITCLILQPAAAGGTVGYAEFSTTEFGLAAATGASVLVDTATNGGNVGRMSIVNSSIFSYVANSTNSISFGGSLGTIILNGNQIGDAFTTGIASGAASTQSAVWNSNDIRAGTNAVFISSAITNPVIQGNRYNGGAETLGGSSGVYAINNAP